MSNTSKTKSILHKEDEVEELPSSSKHVYLRRKSAVNAWSEATSSSIQEDNAIQEDVNLDVPPAEQSSYLKQFTPSVTKEHTLTETQKLQSYYELEKYKDQNRKLLAELKRQVAENDHKQAQLIKYDEITSRLHRDAKSEITDSELQDFKKKARQLQLENDSLHNQLATAKSSISKLVRERDQLTDTIQHLSRTIKELEQRLEARDMALQEPFSDGIYRNHGLNVSDKPESPVTVRPSTTLTSQDHPHTTDLKKETIQEKDQENSTPVKVVSTRQETSKSEGRENKENTKNSLNFARYRREVGTLHHFQPKFQDEAIEPEKQMPNSTKAEAINETNSNEEHLSFDERMIEVNTLLNEKVTQELYDKLEKKVVELSQEKTSIETSLQKLQNAKLKGHAILAKKLEHERKLSTLAKQIAKLKHKLKSTNLS